MIFDKCQCCQEFSVDETYSTDFLSLSIKTPFKEPLWRFEELFSPQEKPIKDKLSILPVRQDRNHFFYQNIWSISHQTNLQNIARGECFEIILQVGFSLHYGKKKRITTKLSHYHLIKQIREHFFYPEMWSISQKTNLKKTNFFLASRLLIKI